MKRRIDPGLLRVVVAAGIAACFVGTAEGVSAQEVPFVPTPHAVVAAMLALAAPVAGDTLLDLGSGDGRIVLAGATLHRLPGWGVEIVPELVRSSAERARSMGVDDLVAFQHGDIFTSTLSGASIITLYLLPETNVRLAGRLLNEARPGTRVISHTFDLGDWSPDSAVVVTHPDGESTVYKWIVPAQVSGTWAMRETGTAAAAAAAAASTTATATATAAAAATSTVAGTLSITQRFQHVTAEWFVGGTACGSLTGRVRAGSARLRLSCNSGAHTDGTELLLTLSSDTLLAELQSADSDGRNRVVRRFSGVRSGPGDQPRVISRAPRSYEK